MGGVIRPIASTGLLVHRNCAIGTDTETVHKLLPIRPTILTVTSLELNAHIGLAGIDLPQPSSGVESLCIRSNRRSHSSTPPSETPDQLCATFSKTRPNRSSLSLPLGKFGHPKQHVSRNGTQPSSWYRFVCPGVIDTQQDKGI